MASRAAIAARLRRAAIPALATLLALAVLPGPGSWLGLRGLPWLAARACADGDRSAKPPGEAPIMRVGGCQTSEREYGLAAAFDSAAVAAVEELNAPGEGPKAGPACKRLGVDAPLFAQIGSVDPLEDAQWVAAAKVLGARMDSCGLVLAERSLLRHTTGPCFPPYHIDLRACGREAEVARFLEQLAAGSWGAFTPTSDRGQRRLLINTVVDLR
jgi:hypothetical protein